ncbi:MAG: TIGR04141 family sporadically distributed protein [Candidatus Cloacimonas sp.]|nr:TIGR04141 family sporadically distributed protein [Candidatus Cloacimonas sp.]
MKQIKKEDITKQINLYLLEKRTNIEDASFPGYAKVKVETKSEPNYVLFFQLPEEKEVKWFNVFNGLNLDLKDFNYEAPKVKYSGFILLINLEKRTYACTGGLGFHALTKIYNIEPRFGLKIAKKIIIPLQLKGLVQKDAGGMLNSLDRVFKPGYLPIGDFENLHRVITNLRASAKKDESTIMDQDFEIGHSIKAGDSLNVSGQKDFKGILSFIERVDSIYNRKCEDTLEIPEMLYVNPKFEKELISKLEYELCEAIKKNKIENLFIDDMEIGFLPDRINSYKIHCGKKARDDIKTVSDVFIEASELLNNDNDINKIQIEFDVDDDIYNLNKKKLRYYICGDITYQGITYFTISNRWYRADEKFVEQLDSLINEITCLSCEKLELPLWGKNYKEDDYIKELYNDKYTILHRHLIHPSNGYDKIELCDIMKKDNDVFYWINIKHASGAKLRELFSQGYTSAHLFRDDREFKNKVINADMDNVKNHQLKKEDIDLLKELENVAYRDIKIIFAIYDETHPCNVDVSKPKTTDALGETLSLYAKIDLLSRQLNIRSLGYDVGVVRIKDK